MEITEIYGGHHTNTLTVTFRSTVNKRSIEAHMILFSHAFDNW